MKKVTAIIATYNGENSIATTIRSIIDQKGVNEKFKLEIIVVDDCSTDNTVNIVKQFDVKLLSTTSNSGGPNKGRNIGLNVATGDCICVVDQDDIWKKHKIIATLPYLEKVPIATSGFTVKDTSKQKNIDRVTQSKNGHLFFNENKTFLTKLTKSQNGQNTYIGAIIFKKELKNVLFEEVFGVVDFDWVLRLFHNRPSIEVTQSLYIRVVDGFNLSLNEEYRRKDFYYSLMFIEQFHEKHPKEVKISNKKIHGSRARYYYFIDNMQLARFYFLRSPFNLKTVLYYITTFVGSSYVKKRFNVFG